MTAEKPEKGTEPTHYHDWNHGRWSTAAGLIITESFVCIFVNGKEFVTMMATPTEQEHLAAGYLFTEGIINDPADLLSVTRSPTNQTCVDVWLKDKGAALPTRRIFTSGCGKGVTYEAKAAEMPALETDLLVRPEQLAELVRQLQEGSNLHREAGGTHGAGLGTADKLLMLTEDIGRHNTLDKLAGRCLLEGVDPAGHILITTGRISSEMVKKAYRMRVPLVASLSTPTSLATRRAAQWGITLVGYLRPRRMRAYCHPERIIQETNQ